MPSASAPPRHNSPLCPRPPLCVQFISGVEDEFPNFFQLPVLMLMLITLLNDGTLISVGYDNVRHSPRPGACV